MRLLCHRHSPDDLIRVNPLELRHVVVRDLARELAFTGLPSVGFPTLLA
jgi:hypothetical protein